MNEWTELKQRFDIDTLHQIAELEKMRVAFVRLGEAKQAAAIATQIMRVKSSRAAVALNIFRNSVGKSA